MAVDRQTPARATDAFSAAGGDPLAAHAATGGGIGARARALAGLPADTATGMHFAGFVTTVSVPPTE